ncbi:transposase [Clostridia bacterium OttesenSCG-928-O13]|nr:transposase [Clostridia bacterium OttesenSCG-928-O13]
MGNKAYKFRIYPNNDQRTMLAKTFGCVRFIYNKMLGDKIDHYRLTKDKLNTTPAQYKNEFVWLKEVDSLALANAQLNLQVAYNNFFRSPKVGFPRFKSKHQNHNSYTTNNQGGTIRIEDGRLRLPKVGLVKLKQHRQIPDGYRLKSATISKTPTDKYYASLLCEYDDVPVVPIDLTSAKPVGLDFSMPELFVSSDGDVPNYPRYYRAAQERLAREQRKLSKCQKGSNNRNKQRKRVAKLHEKVANQRKDFLHKASRQITNAYDVVCVEDLDMKGMAQALNFGKSVMDNGWGSFVTYLGYKLSDEGKCLVKIDKWYPSSKTCSCCGNIKDKLELDERTYVCEECGLVLDRDLNAAINIRNVGVSSLQT